MGVPQQAFRRPELTEQIVGVVSIGQCTFLHDLPTTLRKNVAGHPGPRRSANWSVIVDRFTAGPKSEYLQKCQKRLLQKHKSQSRPILTVGTVGARGAGSGLGAPPRPPFRGERPGGWSDALPIDRGAFPQARWQISRGEGCRGQSRLDHRNCRYRSCSVGTAIWDLVAVVAAAKVAGGSPGT